jgi:hypothetical protein
MAEDKSDHFEFDDLYIDDDILNMLYPHLQKVKK